MIVKLRHSLHLLFFFKSFPHPSQCQPTLYKHQSTHLPVPVVFLPVSVRLMVVLLLFPYTVGGSKCFYAFSEMAEFCDLEKSGTFGFLKRILWGKGSALNPHKTERKGTQVATQLNSIHCKKCWKL